MALGVVIFFNFSDPTTPGGISPECISKKLFGITCPGCGSSRMVYSLVHGDIYGAMKYNFVGIFALILLVFSWISWVFKTNNKEFLQWNKNKYSAKIVLVVVIVWTVIRIIPVVPFSNLQV